MSVYSAQAHHNGAPCCCDTILTASSLFSQAPGMAGPVTYAHAAIAVSNGIIAAMGPADVICGQYTARQTIALGDALLMPGLINAHTHSPMTILRGYADDLPLMTWLNEHIFPMEQRLTPRLITLGAQLACAEMTRVGITAFTDMYLYEDSVFSAVDKAGLRCTGGEVIFSFPSLAYANEQEAMACIRRQAKEWQGHSRITVAVMPHSVYTTTPALLSSCVELAAELDLPLHLHLAETHDETKNCLHTHGKRPLQLCHELGVLGPRTSVAHGIHFTDDELDLLAASGTAVIHCPTSNMKLASGIAPLTSMLSKGITVGLGTDGAASNNSLNMFSEMATAALLHKISAMDPTSIPAETALQLATCSGAAAACRPELGSLYPGGPADIIALDLQAANLLPLHSVSSSLVYAASGHEVCFTMVEGEVLYHNGAYTRIDMDALRHEIRAAMKELRA